MITGIIMLEMWNGFQGCGPNLTDHFGWHVVKEGEIDSCASGLLREWQEFKGC